MVGVVLPMLFLSARTKESEVGLSAGSETSVAEEVDEDEEVEEEDEEDEDEDEEDSVCFMGCPMLWCKWWW